jgi:hypothetical protein
MVRVVCPVMMAVVVMRHIVMGRTNKKTRQGSAEPWRVQFHDVPAVLPNRLPSGRFPGIWQISFGGIFRAASRPARKHDHVSTIFWTTALQPSDPHRSAAEGVHSVAALSDPWARLSGFL